MTSAHGGSVAQTRAGATHPLTGLPDSIFIPRNPLAGTEAGVDGGDTAMQGSHVADDYAAIARRLKELQEEGRRVEERVQDLGRPWLGYPTARTPRPITDPSQPRRT